MGFNFDDTDDEATPLSEMEKLIVKDPKNQERIFSYIGGSEINSHSTHQHHRYSIHKLVVNRGYAGVLPLHPVQIQRRIAVCN
jgi:hypothetical protein